MMKEENTGKKRTKKFTLQVPPAEPQVPEGPAFRFQELPEEELLEMISKNSRYFRTSAGLSVSPN